MNQREGYPIGEVTRQSYDYLHDLALEFLGKKAVDCSEKSLRRKLYVIESISYTSGYLKVMSAWLGTIMHLAMSSHLDLHGELETKLCSLVTEHKEGFSRNYAVLAALLGTEMLEGLCSDHLIPCNAPASAPVIGSSFSFIVTLPETMVLATLLVLINCTRSSPFPCTNVHKKFKQCLQMHRNGSFERGYFGVVEIMNSSICNELETYKRASIEYFLKDYQTEDRDRLDRWIQYFLSHKDEDSI